MMNTSFSRAVAGTPQQVPPIWCMRQAGRYQRAYQQFRRRHTFEELCRDPALAAGVALASVEDFDFDAAILFSDLLFPLDALGLGVYYDDHGPHIRRPLTAARLAQLRPIDRAARALAFQADAVRATRERLPAEKALIGFVGGPWTLFVYAVEGTHRGALTSAKSSLGLYRAFANLIRALLARMIRAQLDAGADLVMVFDTAAGELTPAAFGRHLAPDLHWLARQFPGRMGYYARGLHPAHLLAGRHRPGGAIGKPAIQGVTSPPWAGIGLDWRWDLATALTAPGRTGFVQGNFDPALLHLTGAELRRAIDEFLAPLAALSPDARRGWICGLGHGVLPKTPEDSVRTFVQSVRKRLA